MAIARSRLTSQGRRRWLAAALLCSLLTMAGCADNVGSGKSSMKRLASAYMAIARPANHRLDKEVDSYNEHARDNLASAVADLRAEVATERWFDARLVKIAFPPDVAATARALVQANNQRIALTTRQAQALTVADLVAFNARHRAADAAVEVQVRRIRRQLGLPPPASS